MRVPAVSLCGNETGTPVGCYGESQYQSRLQEAGRYIRTVESEDYHGFIYIKHLALKITDFEATPLINVPTTVLHISRRTTIRGAALLLGLVRPAIASS